MYADFPFNFSGKSKKGILYNQLLLSDKSLFKDRKKEKEGEKTNRQNNLIYSAIR